MTSISDYINSIKPRKSSMLPSFSPAPLSGIAGVNMTSANMTPRPTTPKPTAPTNSPAAASPFYPTPSGKAPSPTTPSPTPTAPRPSPTATPRDTFISTLSSSPMQPPPVGPTPTVEPAAKKDAMTEYLNAYRDYLSNYTKTLKPSEELLAARKKLADVQNTIEERNLAARRGYEQALDTPGMTTSGARESAAMLNRRNAQELADLALSESAAARGLDALTGFYNAESSAAKTALDLYKPLQIGDTYIDPATGNIISKKEAETEFSLSEGQTRYRLNPTTGQYEMVASVPKTFAPSSGSGVIGPSIPGVLSPLAQAVRNGTIALDKIPSAQRAAVAAELATSGLQSTRQETLSANLAVTRSLLDNPELDKISGFIEGKFGLGNLKPSAQLALNQYNQLRGILSLENREKLKGSGAISDFEFKVLSDAATALGRNLSDADFKKQLEIIRDVFEGKYASTNAMGVNPAPDTSLNAQRPQFMELNGQILTLQPDGTYQ